MKRNLTIATCQFPVSRNIEENLSFILKNIAAAKKKGAELVHFSESSLSGYAGIDFETFELQDVTILKKALEQVATLAAKLKIWIIIGSHHYQGENAKPYNCLWLINDNGFIVNRYDKRILTGEPGKLDHQYYRSGRKPVLSTINGIKCGILICHEWRYSELYREQISLGAEVVFQSWYDGNLSDRDYKLNGGEVGSLIIGTIRGHAANNYLWISASNTSKRESCFASFVVQPDGRIFNKSKRNVTGFIISHLDLSVKFEDPSRHWRKQTENGTRSTEVIED